MNPRVLDQYKFYRLCEHDFDMAIHTLKILRRYKRSDVRNALLRDITVVYAKPFSTNRGALSQHSFSLKHVPLPMRGLHKELIDLRNQLFAHTDLTFKNPKVANWSSGKHKWFPMSFRKVANWSSGKHKWFPMSFRGFDYDNLNKRVNEISNLIYSVQNELLKKIKEIENSILT